MSSLRRIAVLALAALPLLACAVPGSGASSAAAADTARELVSHRGDFERRALLTGSLEASRAVALSVPRTPNWQVDLQWLAEDGAAVRAGDPVVELDDSSFASELENQDTALAERVAELERRATEVRTQTREREFEVDRKRSEVEKAELSADVPEGIVPRQELEERRLALAKARLELEKAEADLAAHEEGSAADLEVLRIEIRKSRREIEASRAAVRELELRTPVDGIFLVGDHPWQNRKLQVGDSVWVGLTVATIPDLASLIVEAHLPDVDDGSVAPGMAAVVTLDAYPETSFGGTVREVAPVAQDEGSESLRRFFRTVVELDETDPQRMIPGMSARVEVICERREDVVLVPRAALEMDGEAGFAGATVRLAGGGTETVRLGPCNELECVAEAGLEPGTALAAAGSAAGGPAGSAPAEVAP